MSGQDSTSKIPVSKTYQEEGGTKLRVVQPPEAAANFNYMETPGAMEVELAKFGRFQTGTSIQAPVYMLGYQFNGCLDYDRNGEPWIHGRGGFILLTGGECTYEEKARRVERLGA